GFQARTARGEAQASLFGVAADSPSPRSVGGTRPSGVVPELADHVRGGCVFDGNPPGASDGCPVVIEENRPARSFRLLATGLGYVSGLEAVYDGFRRYPKGNFLPCNAGDNDLVFCCPLDRLLETEGGRRRRRTPAGNQP